MRTWFRFSHSLVFAFALTGAASVSTVAAGAAAGSTQVGTLTVSRSGNAGRVVILIPGLGSGPWVWKDVAPKLAARHVVYTVTLAGFDGTPAPAGEHPLAQAESSLIALIEKNRLDHPVLVGHSLGGTLALKVAAEHPQLLGGVVAVDGLPVFPMTEQLVAAQRQAMAAQAKARMGSASPAQFQAQQLAYMQTIGTTDPARAQAVAKLQDRSDPKAVAAYMADDMALDFRVQMKDAAVPILEISPYNPADAAAYPKPFSEDQKTAYWRSLLGPAPNAKVVSISPARHFVMLDQPAEFQQALDGFLGSL